jgi:hypothetical protein
MSEDDTRKKGLDHRRYFIGGSDARKGEDEVALLRLWREKRGRSSLRISPAI